MRVYMDYAATTMVSEATLEAMLPCFTQLYGNPSSIHQAGQQAAQLLEQSRETLARILNVPSQTLYFTSGGTEANNWALRIGAEAGARRNRRHIVSSAMEHHSVLHTLEGLEQQGFEITLVPPDREGIVQAQSVLRALREDTALVSILYANNEIGTLQPAAELAALCRERNILFHTDAVQAVGTLPLDLLALGADLLTCSAHKFYGPKGAGALYCRKGIPLSPFIRGGAQEREKRGGTENVPAIAGMARALELAAEAMDENIKKETLLRERLISSLCGIPGVTLTGHRQRRLPGIVSLIIEGIASETLLVRLDQAGICASAGSACTSGSLEPSHVLLAMGVPPQSARCALRLSIGAYTTREEVDYVIDTLKAIIHRLR